MTYFIRILTGRGKKTYLVTEDQALVVYEELAGYNYITSAERGFVRGTQVKNRCGSLCIWGKANVDKKLLFTQMLSGEVAQWNWETGFENGAAI